MKQFKAWVNRFLLGASPPRAWLEMLLFGLLLLLGVRWIASSLSVGYRQNGVFIATLSGVTLYTLRLRLPRGRWWRQLLIEIVWGAGALLLAAVLLALGIYLIADVVSVPREAGLLTITVAVLRLDQRFRAVSDVTTLFWFVVLLCNGIAFLSTRLMIHLWLFWAQLRRRRLIWALTHSHLMLVVVGVLLLSALTVFNYLHYLTSDQSSDAPTLLVVLFDLVPLTIAMGTTALVLLVVVLPPATLLSYFAARRTTRRLEALVQATAALRAGDHGVQVAVQGEDKVAQLQADFNAMAADLTHAMHNLETERDAVATLLESRRQLVTSVSHELRTPVAIMRGHLEAMLARWTDIPAVTLHEKIVQVAQQTRHLQCLIDDLFTLSRAEVDQLDMRPRAIDVGAVVERCVSAAAPVQWQACKIELVADVPPDLPLARADETRLEQILHNLLRNAARHTPTGGIVAVSAHAAAGGARPAAGVLGAVIIQVKDTGEGISPEDLPHIWERFYRADSAREHERDGAGLGLALVKELTEAMGGTVAVESIVGQGSCFTVRLPRA